MTIRFKLKGNSYDTCMMDFFLKMVVFIFNVFFLPRCSSFIESAEPHICTSKDDAVSCICKNREHFSLNPSMNFDIRLIQVSGCGSVVITFGAVTQLEIEKIVFSDIHMLTVQPYSFAGALSLNTLHLENIEIFHVSTAGFTGLLNVSDIIIRNISSMIVEEEGFGGISTVENFVIQSANFTEIKRNAFILTNITNFKLVDSEIVLQTNSFLIHNANFVLFQNCSIPKITEYSLGMAYVDLISFIDCNIGILDKNSVYLKYPVTFQFDSCSVSALNKYAFHLENIVKSVTFTHNIIKFSNGPPVYFEINNSSNINEDQNLNVLSVGNSFLCNCDIYWMWESEKPFYDTKSSFCIGSNICLSHITPKLDSSGNCTALDLSNLKGNSNQKVITNVESTEDLDFGVHSCIASQAISTGTLLNMPFMSLIIVFKLAVFLYPL